MPIGKILAWTQVEQQEKPNSIPQRQALRKEETLKEQQDQKETVEQGPITRMVTGQVNAVKQLKWWKSKSTMSPMLFQRSPKTEDLD